MKESVLERGVKLAAAQRLSVALTWSKTRVERRGSAEPQRRLRLSRMKPSTWNRLARGGGDGLGGCAPIEPGGRGAFDDGIACAICGRACGVAAIGGRGGAGARGAG